MMSPDVSAPAQEAGALDENLQIAEKLRELADLLETQQANPFRVGAYRKAAVAIEDLDTPLRKTLKAGGVDALIALPGIGQSIARAIKEMLTTGRWAQLERLRGTASPEQLFRTVPGIGPELAHRIHDELHIDTLEELELAAHDGRLQDVKGVGPRRAAMMRAALATMLARTRPPRAPGGAAAKAPPVAEVLRVDKLYRDLAEAGRLPRIAPKRFNPSGEAWLPVLHEDRTADGEKWHYTALYSNTARAHELERTRDWVVIYFHSDTEQEGQCTVVTETRGSLVGRRVIRGREPECRDFYDRGRG